MTQYRLSFAHRVLSNITKNQHDAPMCVLATPSSTSNPSHPSSRGGDRFMALCSLTEILGDVLPLVYKLNIRSYKDAAKTAQRTKADPDERDETPRTDDNRQ